MDPHLGLTGAPKPTQGAGDGWPIFLASLAGPTKVHTTCASDHNIGLLKSALLRRTLTETNFKQLHKHMAADAHTNA